VAGGATRTWLVALPKENENLTRKGGGGKVDVELTWRRRSEELAGEETAGLEFFLGKGGV